ncbi:uncharacterized protein [Mycetomoellerius zeteki]|uniref:uncharacterized protein n=1 Tax=Mycetomoellerius zeteki TaxID=64791 RepID=UPI00084E4F89|nr:PREDICTED: uncharacterized protein LOC108721118 [Trachymyrmex zeteki]
MALSLSRIMANIGGPGEGRRRLYTTAVMAVIMYGPPIWARTVMDSRSTLRDVGRLQRQLALRVIRGYRTVSHDAAAILARMVPFDLACNKLRRSYLHRREIIARDGAISPRTRDAFLEVERRRSIAMWRERLLGLPSSGPGAIVRDAIVEDLEVWVDREHGALTYRVTQILTGHGVFEAYLCRIGRRTSPTCLYCRAATDTAVHTLLFCPAWAEQRGDLLQIVGIDRTYKAVVRAIIRSNEVWALFMNLCETIMRKKEEDE